MPFSSIYFGELEEEILKQIERIPARFRPRLQSLYEESTASFRDEICEALADYESDGMALEYSVETFLREKMRELSYEEYLDLMDFQMSATPEELRAIFGAEVPEVKFRAFQESLVPLSQEDFLKRPIVVRPANNLGLYQRHRPRGAGRNQLQRWEQNRSASVYDRWEVFAKFNDRAGVSEEKKMIEPGATLRSKDDFIRSGSRAKVQQLLGMDSRAYYAFYNGLTGDPHDYDLARI